MLNVWASWCAPCRAEADDLQKVSSELEGKGVQFVGLNTRDSQAAAEAFVDRFALTYPSVVDTDGSRQLLFRETLPACGHPLHDRDRPPGPRRRRARSARWTARGCSA